MSQQPAETPAEQPAPTQCPTSRSSFAGPTGDPSLYHEVKGAYAHCASPQCGWTIMSCCGSVVDVNHRRWTKR